MGIILLVSGWSYQKRVCRLRAIIVVKWRYGEEIAQLVSDASVLVVGDNVQ